MSREEIAFLIGWKYIAWFVCAVGVVAMLPQLIKILRMRKVDDLSPSMFWTVFLSQLAYAFDGFFTKNMMLMTCMSLGAAVTLSILVLYYRWRKLA